MRAFLACIVGVLAVILLNYLVVVLPISLLLYLGLLATGVDPANFMSFLPFSLVCLVAWVLLLIFDYIFMTREEKE